MGIEGSTLRGNSSFLSDRSDKHEATDRWLPDNALQQDSPTGAFSSHTDHLGSSSQDRRQSIQVPQCNTLKTNEGSRLKPSATLENPLVVTSIQVLFPISVSSFESSGPFLLLSATLPVAFLSIPSKNTFAFSHSSASISRPTF